MVITPAALTALGGHAGDPGGFLPSPCGIPGVQPSKRLGGAETPLSQGRGSVRDPQELADVSPL